MTFSHWILDFLTHRPDLPLGLTEGDKVGLGLWNSLPGTLVVEGALFGVGVYLYLKTQTRASKGRRYATFGLVAFLKKGRYSLIITGNDTGVASAMAATVRDPGGKTLRVSGPTKDWCIFRTPRGTNVSTFLPAAAGCRPCFGTAKDP